MSKHTKYEVIERPMAFSDEPFLDHTYGIRENRQEALDFADELRYNAYYDDLIIVYEIEPDNECHYYRENGVVIYEQRGIIT